MPADLWATTYVYGTPTLTPTRKIVPSDWDRVLIYAPRVKSLFCDNPLNPKSPATIAVYQTLQHEGVPGNYLLPNLEHLWWQHDDPAYSPFIDLFLGPRITSIKLGPRNDGRCHPALATLGQTHPGLRSFEELDIRTVDTETLKYLGHLPTLKTLRTILPPTPLSAVADSSMFSELRGLSFWPEQQDPDGGEIAPLIALLRTCNNPPLTSFEAPSIVHWNLDQLMLEFMDMEPPVLPPHPGRFFRPLFDFTRLTVVEIQVPAGYDLDDATVEDMAGAWPNLEEFGLRARSNYEPRCTVLSLQSFARHCPRLWVLAITLDASAVPGPQGPSTDAPFPPQDKLKCLNVASSRTSDASVAAVAAFISSIFSNLHEIMTDEGYLWEEDDEVGRQHHQRWKEIERLVPGLVERHRKELEILETELYALKPI
ncbi:hypothetical protein MVEN_01552800 [Mycena venus]|uniref:Uncharacterized protein n=1 Tax=Mycena venus TaxID=2733690 RepID=A0A8H6XRZ3_9AGAR|nr:hypothetical protein MVEN_01552800 [Mycena venus]